ncbi:MAG: antitoxin [Burkholderiales bacterium RIFCSPLOWO2_12_FULL_61_40]|nr:MAG: antitoxin [Burkholderiales bacterium RIFCSPLOWO2_12_FULL_61_40]
MNTAAYVSETVTGLSAASVLGGEPVLHALPRSVLEWIALVRLGISAGAVDAAVRVMGIGQSELARALDIPERTLARRKKEGVLSSDESGKMVRLAQVIERAVEVFEDEQTALAWLKSPNAALGGSSPLSLLDTELGSMAVVGTLGRIEHGVFA